MRYLRSIWKAILLIGIFTVLYLILALIKHNHYLSGYDIAVYDQVIWKYAFFHNPLTTIHAYPFTYMFTDHVELILVFLAPLFWIRNNIDMLFIAQAVFFCLSGLPMYLLAKRKGINELLSLTLLFSYLFFFGTQNALWNDMHTNVFGVGFISWMLYFLESKNTVWTSITFFLAITAKEDMGFLTFAIGIVFLLKNYKLLFQKNFEKLIAALKNYEIKMSLILIIISVIYLFLIFFIYFPYFVPGGYRFQSHEGLLQSINLKYFADTASKREIIFYSLGWFGFVPLLAPLYLIPWFADLFHFFVIGHAVESASEIFLHYRISLAPLLVLPTIIVLGKWKKLQHPLIAVYLILCAFTIQYVLHLPLSYLTKSWFWQTPQSVTSINRVLAYLPQDASVVSQNNITPHIAHRDLIFTLWPDVRTYKTASQSPCGKIVCRWFHWVGNPTYMIVDTGPDWDIRHFLADRPNFLEALHNFEQMGKIQVYKRDGTTTLYKVLQNP